MPIKPATIPPRRARQKGKDKAKEKVRDRGSRFNRTAEEEVAKDPSASDSSSGVRSRRGRPQGPPWLLAALAGGLLLSLIMAITGIWLISKRLNAPVVPEPAAPVPRRAPPRGADELPPFETQFKLEKHSTPPADESGS